MTFLRPLAFDSENMSDLPSNHREPVQEMFKIIQVGLGELFIKGGLEEIFIVFDVNKKGGLGDLGKNSIAYFF